MNEFLAGLRSYIEANGLVVKYRLWPYLLLPGTFGMIYMGLVVFGIWMGADDLAQWMISHLPEFFQHAAMRVVLHVLLWIGFMLTGFLAYKHVVLILFAPVLGYIGEVADDVRHGVKPPEWSWDGFWSQILDSFLFNLINLFLSLLMSFLAWCLIFIPFIGGLISTPVIAMVQWHYAGQGILAPPLERRGWPISERMRFSRENKGRAMGLGLGFSLLVLVPVVGWFLAPSYSTIAAVCAFPEAMKDNRNASDPTA